ncbi:MAG: hypothetical protein AAFV85_17985 [Cyanobacteria bacterium J06634_6]
MTRHLTLELSDEAYAKLQMKANSVGLQLSEWVANVLNHLESHPNETIVYETENKHDSLLVSETALLSEAALAEDWNKPAEEEAWSHLQLEQ